MEMPTGLVESRVETDAIARNKALQEWAMTWDEAMCRLVDAMRGETKRLLQFFVCLDEVVCDGLGVKVSKKRRKMKKYRKRWAKMYGEPNT